MSQLHYTCASRARLTNRGQRTRCYQLKLFTFIGVFKGSRGMSRQKHREFYKPMLNLFSLALLVPIPGAHGHPHFPFAILPKLDNPEWEAALLQFQASLDVPGTVAAVGLRPWGPLLELGPEDPRLGLLRELVAENSWGQEGMRRGQRGDLERRPLGPFTGPHMDTLHYQEGGGKRNEALTSIAGGLQAFNREKGGFGFRFGRK